MGNSQPWLVWALLSAVFAALTAIFARIAIGMVGACVVVLVF